MPKLFLLFALAGCGLFMSESAMADGIEGRWIHSGTSDLGAPFSTVVSFHHGEFQYEMGIGQAPGYSGSTKGIIDCVGRYRFDGQMLATSSSCSMGPPLKFGGQVQFLDQQTISIAGDSFRRY
jgi:hypothetical protein